MLAMERKIVFFLLATSVLLCAKRGHAMVPKPYEELFAMLEDKYEDEMVQGSVEARNSGNFHMYLNFQNHQSKIILYSKGKQTFSFSFL